jgi:hypothetical protein
VAAGRSHKAAAIRHIQTAASFLSVANRQSSVASLFPSCWTRKEEMLQELCDARLERSDAATKHFVAASKYSNAATRFPNVTLWYSDAATEYFVAGLR